MQGIVLLHTYIKSNTNSIIVHYMHILNSIIYVSFNSEF